MSKRKSHMPITADSTQVTISFTRVEALMMACDTWEARECVWKREKEQLLAALRLYAQAEEDSPHKPQVAQTALRSFQDKHDGS